MIRRLFVIPILIACAAWTPPKWGDISGAGTTVAFYYVTDPAYGALGDGSTNDTAAINLAVNTCYTNGGGVVIFPAGTYICQGVNLKPGVFLEGAGSWNGTSSTIGGSTILKAPASPAANTPILRPPAGFAWSVWSGGGVKKLTIHGNQYTSTQAVPAAVSSNKMVGLSLATDQKQACTFAADDTITLNNHGYSNGNIVQFSYTSAPGANAATVFDENSYYVVSAQTNTFKISTTLGGAAIDISSAGTGTYVGRASNDTGGTALGSTNNFVIDDVNVFFCDQGIVTSAAGAIRTLISNCFIAYNWVGINGQEHPQVETTRFDSNNCAMTGRYLDAVYSGLCFASDKYDLVPFGSGGPYGSTFGRVDTGSAATHRSSYVTGCSISNCKFFGTTGGIQIGLNNGNTVTNCGLSGSGTAGSFGIFMQGDNVIIGNVFGQSSTATSYGRGAIGLDVEFASTFNGTSIVGNKFKIIGCPCIVQTNMASSIFGTGALGNIVGTTIIGNTHITPTSDGGGTPHQGDRFIDARSNNGEMNNCIIAHNVITTDTNLTGGSLLISNNDGYIEGTLYSDCILSDNELIGGAAGQFLYKQVVGAGADVSCQITGNRSHAALLGSGVTELFSLLDNPGVSSVFRDNFPTTTMWTGDRVFSLQADQTAAAGFATLTGFSFTVAASQAYYVEVELACSTDTSGVNNYLDLNSAGTPFVTTESWYAGTYYGDTGTLTPAAGAANFAAFSSTSSALGTTFIVNDATGGANKIRTVRFQFCFTTGASTTVRLQASSASNNWTVYKGAKMLVRRIR